MYALLTALSMLFPTPDLSNHWRWASASVNNATTNPTPVPSPVIPSPTPTPNPVPTPPNPILKPGDDCPGCTGGWIDSDGSAKVKCWKCNGDGRVDIGDPILTGGQIPPTGILSKPSRDGKLTDKSKESKEEEKAREGTGTKGIPKRESTIEDETDNLICYKPQYSPEGYWILDPEANQWVRSAKQAPITKQVETGHWETRTKKVYTSCCGWQTQKYQVWVEGPTKTVTEQPKPRTSYYPIRGSWWTGCRNWQHLTKGQHAGKFDPAYLQKLSWEELQSLHSDNHEGRTKWQYVNK